jgi:3-ketosteroid 9alpha-monooxygenase subunit A
VSFSDEIAPGEAKPVRYFGQDLVLFRTESGQPKILDAFCPHLGAHLGHGGKVEGENIRCPFHAWQFNGAGECTEVPYAKKIPKKARIECWPVREINGMIYVYHDEDKGEPDWEIPEMPEFGTEDWTDWDHAKLRVQTHPREIVENVADFGHFIPVHGTHISSFDNEYDRHMATQLTKGVAYPVGGGEDNFDLVATYYGPAYQVTLMDGFLKSRLVNCHTPVGPNTLDLRFAVSVKAADGTRGKDEIIKAYANNLREGFLQDIRIWENKVYRERPVLCDGDGPIGKLRKWYQQFYLPKQSTELRA